MYDPNFAPLPSQTSQPPKKRHHAFATILFLLLAGGAGAAGYVYGYQEGTAGLSKIVPQIKAPGESAPADETVKAKLILTKTPAPGAPMQTIEKTISFKAPLAWRAQHSVEGAPEDTFCVTDPDTKVAPCLAFTMADALGPESSLAGANRIQTFALEDWRRANTPGSADRPFTFAGLETTGEKQAAIEAIQKLGKDSELSPKSIETLFNPFIANAAFMGVSEVKYLESADGLLRGYSFIASQGQQASYAPRAFSVLLGEVDGVLTLVTGSFRLHDTKEAELDGIIKAKGFDSPPVQGFFKNYGPGYEYAADTKAQYEKAMSAMGSIKLEGESKL